MMRNQTEDDSSIRYFHIYFNLLYLIFGNVGNLFKLAFFLQEPLRSVSCTIYIFFSTFCNFITLNNLPVFQLLIHVYPNYHWIKTTVDWSNHRNETVLFSFSASSYDIMMCKIRTYLHMLSTDLSFQMLLFASINRFYSFYRRRRPENISHRLFRHFCEHPNVYKLCIISSIITALLSLQHAFNFTVVFPSEGCIPYSRVLWVVWILSIHCFLLPILMIIFGILTLRNTGCLTRFGDYFQCRHHHPRRRRHRSLEKYSHYQKSIQHKIDKQLTSMIISEICVTILTLLPYGAYAVYDLHHGIQGQTIYHTNRTKWIVLFIRVTMYFEASCGFYIYLFTLTTMRKRFLKIISKKITGIAIRCWNK
jgi:hypothetical protein